MENTTRPSTEDIKKALQSINLLVENWINTQHPISLLEKDLIKDHIRSLYQFVDGLSSEKKLDNFVSQKFTEKLELQTEKSHPQNLKISEEVTHTLQKADLRSEIAPIISSESEPETISPSSKPTIQEMIENATVINSTTKSEVLESSQEKLIPEEKLTAPLFTHHAIEEKTMEARIQEVKAATRYDEIRTIGSTYSPGESVSDKINKTKTEKSISEKLTTQPLVDLKISIGINERFAFINELFHGDQQLYHQSIDKINSMHVYEEAKKMIDQELMPKLNWDASHSRLQEFDKLIKRRFNA